MLRIRTESGTELSTTPSHPLFVARNDGWRPVRAEDLSEGTEIASYRSIATDGGEAAVPEGRSSCGSPGEAVTGERIETIERVEPEDEWVYDLEVADTHSYVSNGIVSHNSQLLQYVQKISPRSVYTSGKGASSAGLTAAAIKDDFGDGQQWSLEAGALVLADRGIAAVDELDKMRCVTGDTLVQCGDDGLRRIREVAEEAAETGTVEPIENGRTVRDVELTVHTMADDGRIVRRPVTAVHEYEAPDDLREVTLESGESVVTTPDHPFFVLEGGERAERPADGLEAGDWVYVPREIPTAETDGGEVVADPSAAAADDPGRPDGDAGLTPAHGAVLGYVAGDGNVFYDRTQGCYGIRFTNAEEQLLADFERACRTVFDAEPTRPPSERRENGVETVRLTGKEFVDELLAAGLNLETYDGKRIPEGVATGSRATKAAFVRALADSEGHVDGQKVAIVSSSRDLLLGTKAMLLEFGITTQLRTDEREGRRDVYELVVTSEPSLTAFEEHVGFTLDRKQAALEAAVAAADGDRTILDVVPDCGDLLAEARDSLRLYQRECGLVDATYCNFENGDANVSLHRAATVLDRFEERRRRAERDAAALEEPSSWDELSAIKERYHVSQAELADGTDVSQWRVSTDWGEDPDLRRTVRHRLREVVSAVAETDLRRLRELVRGDVKWRRVSAVEPAEPSTDDDRIPVLEERIAALLGLHDGEDVLERARELVDRDADPGSFAELRAELDRWGIPLADVAEEMGVDQSTVSRWFRGVTDGEGFDAVREASLRLIDERRSTVADRLEEIDRRRRPKVYDLTVEGTHNFVANGTIIHNSEDRSAMHQALEQQEVSISKAGINATLKSRCALLGAANPKYGRFDQYEPIGEQIDLEPALISRFDLIFIVTDQPDEEEDRRLADHILTTNYAGELNTQREEMTSPDVSREEVESFTREVDPEIDPDLFRKYVAYAKQTCHPRMTEPAREAIKEFYTDLRAKGTDEDAPVPVTARKLEAIVRLAEASARIRLSDEVTRADADRVIEIVRSCLQDVGVDPETGEFDADVVEAGTSKSQRDRIKNIRQLIEDVEDEYDGGAPIDVVLDRAEEIGMDRSKAEHEIDKLKQKGELYQPNTDHLRTT
jgi:replicative DNA helicase Mcm